MKQIVLIALFVVLLLTGCMPSLPTAEEAGVSFSTIESIRPEDSTCINQSGARAGLTKELVNISELLVVIGGGDNPMPDSEWESFSPFFPWSKNIDRFTMFDNHCFYRSPDAPADCQADDCILTRQVNGYTWVELTRVHALDCIADPGASCSLNQVGPGAISISVTEKCHQIVFAESIYELVDPQGNRYVMHATENGTPSTDASLPEGWTLQQVALSEPLVVNPFGGGEACFHNVLRDNLGQGYHQYSFAEATYP